MNRRTGAGAALLFGMLVVALLAAPAGTADVIQHGPDDAAGIDGQDRLETMVFDSDPAGGHSHHEGEEHFLRSMPASPPRAMDGHGAVIEFECPEAQDADDRVLMGSSSFTVYGCPLRVYDAVAPGVRGLPVGPEEVNVPTSVGWLFGNVQIAVQPDDPTQAAFFSLHGDPAPNEREGNARANLTHTTFTTENGGLTWSDQPTRRGHPYSGAKGEWASGAMDRHGRLYPTYLWNTPREGGIESRLDVYWAGTPSEGGSVTNAYNRGYALGPRQDGDIMERAHIVYVPIDDEEDDNDTGVPEPGDLGDMAVVRNESDLVTVVWHERSVEPQRSPTGMSAWIDVMWADTGSPDQARTMREQSGSNWTFLRDDELIGPCRGSSNPVVWDEKVYVACIVERGYDARNRARVGEVDLWQIDPATGKTKLMSYTGIDNTDHVVMTVTPDGYFALASTTVVAEQQIEAKVSMGWHGTSWGRQGDDVGPRLHDMLGLIPVRDAHITGLALSETEKTLFLVYKEWNDREEDLTLRPNGLPRLSDYKKAVVAMNACWFPLAAAEFQLGEIIDAHQYEKWQEEPAMFNDRQDGLQTVRLPSGEERVHVAINDYGAVQYASIVPTSAAGEYLCDPGVPQPAIITAMPAALAVTTGASTLIGSAVGLVSLAMVTYLLAVRKRSPLEAVAKDE